MSGNRDTTAKIGRPTCYTQELADHICAELATGKSMRTVCRATDMPAMSTVFLWLRERRDFSEQYARAKVEAADALVEEIMDIADDATNDWMETHDKDGNAVGYRLNGEHVQRSRLRIDARKWVAAKLKPKKYGERLDLDNSGQPSNPLAELIQSIQGTALKPVQRGGKE
ncbi:terminase small subunit protein [Camelimonas lactis]|uniref:Terminase small subunit protein n=1 Tax=Camelimonas lactis TaxID=659006 RepID=A0A4R2GUA1_9HYPH|nr:terminase small subunit protein [Camelimonas lactis]TCO13448.1 hypothetical protein EV666_106161 [Camelimonas lactis]